MSQISGKIFHCSWYNESSVRLLLHLALIWPHGLSFVSKKRRPEYNKPLTTFPSHQDHFLGHASMFCTIKHLWQNLGGEFSTRSMVTHSLVYRILCQDSLITPCSTRDLNAWGKWSKVISHLKVLSKHTLFNSIFCFSVKLPSLCLRSFRITRCKDQLN